VDAYERDEAVLHELAAVSIEVMITRIERGEDATAVVTEVLGTVFGSRPASQDLDKMPTEQGDLHQAAALIDDPVKLKRIVATVLELLADLNRPSEQ
jgi:hypothetical protein